RRQHADLLRFRTGLEAAGQELLEEARRTFAPPLPTDVAGESFPVVQRWVEGLLGPVLEPPTKPLADGGIPWQEWDGPRFQSALRGRAEEDAAPYQSRLNDAAPREQVADPTQLTALARRSQPLVPVTCWAYDSHPQHVFQRWLVPQEMQEHWSTVSLPGGE